MWIPGLVLISLRMQPYPRLNLVCQSELLGIAGESIFYWSLCDFYCSLVITMLLLCVVSQADQFYSIVL